MNKKTLCILLSMAMLSHQVTYASDQSLSGDVGPSGQSEVVIDMPIQEEEVAHTNEETMDANMEGNGASCSDVTVLEATASEAAPMKDTKTGECDSEAGELKEDQGAYAHVVCFGLLMVRSIIRVIGIRMPIEMQFASQTYIRCSPPITCRLFRPQQLPAAYIRHMAQMGVQTCRFRSVPEVMVP